MKLRMSVCLIVVVSLGAAAGVRGNDVGYADFAARMQQLEELVSDQQQQLEELYAQQQQHAAAFQTASYALGGHEQGDDKSGDGCRDTSGFYAAVELAILRGYVGGNVFGRGTGVDSEHRVSPRIILGYERCDGVGVRARYWYFDEDYNATAFPPPGLPGGPPVPPGPIPTTLGFDMDVVDLETTIRKSFWDLDLMFSGGARYARVELNSPILPVAGNANYFEGGGLTVSIEVRKAIGCSGLSLIGNYRPSLLYGHQRGTFPTDDESWMSHEINLGVEYARSTQFGDVALAAGWENQVWSNHIVGEALLGVGSHISFGGPNLRFEVRR